MGPRVALVNCWHDSNRGDSAIILGTVASFLENLPGATFAAHYVFTSASEYFNGISRHLERTFPLVDVVGSAVPNRAEFGRSSGVSEGALGAKLCWAGSLMWSLRMLCHPECPGSGRGLVDTLRQADVVVNVGGHHYKAPQGTMGDLARLYIQAHPLLLARRVRRPFAVFGQSIGPIRGALARRFVRVLFSRSAYLGVREAISRDELIGCGLPRSSVCVVPDPAFALRPDPSARVRFCLEQHRLIPRQFAVLTARPWFFGQRAEYEAYIEVLAQVARHLVDRGYRVAILAHTSGPTATEDDRNSSADLLRHVDCLGEVTLVEEDMSPAELAALYGYAKVLVGTRLHSVILSLLAGTPAYAISYFGSKAPGTMDMMGLGGFVSDIRGLEVAKVIRGVNEIIDRETGIRAHIRMRVSLLRQRVVASAGALIGRVLGGDARTSESEGSR